MKKTDKLQNTETPFSSFSKEELIAMITDLKSNLSATQNAVSQLKHDIKEKDITIAELKELLRMRQAGAYIPSSEQMNYLFPEIEAFEAALDNKIVEEERIEKVIKVKKNRVRHNTCQAPALTPTCDIHHTDNAPQTVVNAEGVTLERVEDYIEDKISIIQAQIIVERHHYAQYKSSTVDVKPVVLFENEKLDKTAATPNLITNIIMSKFDDHLPLYRQEEIFKRNGIYLSRQKMASWLIAWYEMLLPLEKLIKKEIYSSAFLNKDETPVLVLDLKGPNGKPSKNSFMYVTIGSTYNSVERKTHTLKMFEFIKGRSGAVLLDDYKRLDYSAPIMSDGLKGYLEIPSDKHCCCWVHAVRQLKAILKTEKKETNALELVTLAAKLYDIDDKYRAKLISGNIDVDTFLLLRKTESIEVINAIFNKINDIKGSYSPSGAMGKALNYLIEYKPLLNNYLEVVEATPSNNIAEQSIKSFVTGRKNWLFAQSIDGADTSAFFYSLIETAKESNISPSDYIEAVTTFALSCKSEEDWKALLPWNIDLSKLEKIRSIRKTAHPDKSRTKPYIFCGANG